MRTTSPLLLVVGILLSSAFGWALDYFGDIEANSLVLKVESCGHALSSQPALSFPFYLLLRDGVPLLSLAPDSSDSETPPRQGRLQIVNLSEYPSETPGPGETSQAFRERLKAGVTKTQELVFEFDHLGWASDWDVIRVTVPYSTVSGDRLQMLHLAEKGILQSIWHDPKNKAVEVVSYSLGVGARIPVRITVLENTLGFGNKLTCKKAPSALPTPVAGPTPGGLTPR